MNKPLSAAQQRHTLQLIEIAQRAQDDVNRFVAYLREEHDAQADDWKLENIKDGFVRKADTPNPE
jgi:hypothetical protein